MEIEVSGDQIKLNKELNDLDKLVIDFVKILDRNKVNYVLVSGYVSILFGRSRSSEDIDIIVEKISEKQFSTLWRDILKSFECIITDNLKDAYENYLMQRSSVRFSRKGEFIPNMELMFPKAEDLDNWVLNNGKQVILNGKVIKISPIELQIPYKLFLDSEKDIEDARHLYKLFNGKMDQKLFKQFLVKLDKKGRFNKYLI
ncbi:hypothetical protein [Nitrososphaera sp.]|uniref:hypothetical protein n=1 Tax=Nitrososphaera sp. TaxID=1971748 RepID=UPI002EDA0E92